MNRREFTKMAGLSALAMHSIPGAVSTIMAGQGHTLKVPIGIGNHSLRAMRPNATELIEFAIKHRLDSVQFNTASAFESFEDDYLAKIKTLAHSNDITIYVGVGSICESSVKFSDRYGDAKTLIQKGIHIAEVLESPIVGLRIGMLDDRYTDGGIKPKIEEVVRLMRSFRGNVLNAGIKFAFENHTGDMRSGELLKLINEAGADICGAFFDPGNAIYAMEDPEMALETVGMHIICCQARDVMIWPSENGAIFQWTAIGEGMMDFKHFTRFLSEKCPGIPIHIETISNSPRSIPYLTSEYWKGFPDLQASEIIDFLKLVKKGNPIEVAIAAAGKDKKTFDTENQITEFLKSARFLREECKAGLKS